MDIKEKVLQQLMLTKPKPLLCSHLDLASSFPDA